MPTPNKLHVDSNVLLRYLTGDPPSMAEKARRLFRQVEAGTTALILEEIIVAEMVWVLQSFYRHSARDISKRLMQLLLGEGIECRNRDVVLGALQIYGETAVKFGDALLAAHMLDQGADTVYSFDEHFDRVPGIKRLLPDETPSP